MESASPGSSAHTIRQGFPRRLLRAILRNKWRTALILLVLGIGWELGTLPWIEIRELKTRNPGETAFMREHAERARTVGRKVRRVQHWVPLSRIPSHVRNAVIVAEDGLFWSHGGFDWYEFRVSFERNLKERRAARGASTITQQLAKNLYLSSSKNPLRKVREWILTWWMEQQLDKKRILELYLNVIEWGDGLYGVEAASREYFAKSVEELNKEEAARLAAIIPSPRRHRADADSRYVVRRSTIILDRMAARGM